MQKSIWSVVKIVCGLGLAALAAYLVLKLEHLNVFRSIGYLAVVVLIGLCGAAYVWDGVKSLRKRA